MSNQTAQKENVALYVIRISAILLAITVVVAAALAFVNSITAPKIAENTARKTQEAIAAVLDGGYDTELWKCDEGLETVSSTAVRAALDGGKDASDLLPKSVYDYIKSLEM